MSSDVKTECSCSTKNRLTKTLHIEEARLVALVLGDTRKSYEVLPEQLGGGGTKVPTPGAMGDAVNCYGSFFDAYLCAGHFAQNCHEQGNSDVGCTPYADGHILCDCYPP